jgi:hypothetical protein
MAMQSHGHGTRHPACSGTILYQIFRRGTRRGINSADIRLASRGTDSLTVAARFWETAGLRQRLVDASGGRGLAPVARCCNKIWIWLKLAGGCGGVRIQAGIVIQISSGRPGGRSLMWG